MSTRNVSVLIGPDISLIVKLWALFIALIEQTGANGTWVLASSGAPHDDTSTKSQRRGFLRTGLRSCRSLFHRRFRRWNKELVLCPEGALGIMLEPIFYDTKTCIMWWNLRIRGPGRKTGRPP